MRCVDSIVLQPVDKMEIILVDDGSTDGSSGICDNIKRQYEDENCEIKVIHKENGGLSTARNAGIAASTGELITFIDSDDFLGRNTYSKQMEFFECADDVDVVEFPVAKFYNEFLKKENIEFTVDFYDSPIDYLYETEASKNAVEILQTADLREAFEPEQAYENPDGTPILFDADLCGNPRAGKTISGPFA